VGTAEAAAHIAAALRAADGGPLFGVPGGGGNLDLVGAVEEAGIAFVLCHGETAAAIAAATWGEETGRVAACVATRGPGAASMANGLAHALLDRAPLLVVTDGIPAADRRRVPHQRLDHGRLLAETVKATAAIDDDPELARSAVALAVAAPPGPVHLDVVPGAARSTLPVPRATSPDPEALRRVRALVGSSRRPVVVAGVGARRCGPAIAALVDGTRVPVLTTYKAKGLAPAANDAGLLTGGTLELPVLAAADLVVGVGLDPVELIPAPWRIAAPVVLLGSWPVRDGPFPVACEVVGDVATVVAGVGPLPDGWVDDPAGYRTAALARLGVSVAGLDPRAVVAAVATAAPEALATVDAGAHMLVAMPFWEGRALTSSGLATMGFALPGAIGAALANSGRRVVCLTGDGGLAMCAAELETLARLDLPVTVVVFDDAALSLIEIKQRPVGHGGARAVRFGPTDWAAVARGFGVPAARVDSLAALDTALSAGGEGPQLIDVLIDPAGYGAVLAATRG
jgi:acetolactate synthase-1/2/3 large subunit